VTRVLAYTCPSKWGPYECGPVDYWVSQGLAWLFGGAAVLIGLAWLVLWVTDHRRPWRAGARAEAARQRGLAELDRRAPRRRAERPETGHSPFRRPPGSQPW
jgi:hypothetical protein